MPSRVEHEARAQSNERVAAQFRLADPDEVTWAVTIIFYAALHWLEAYFDETAGIHHESLAERFDSIAPLPISTEFRLLYYASRRARYEINPFVLPEVNALMGYYAAVKLFAQAALSEGSEADSSTNSQESDEHVRPDARGQGVRSTIRRAPRRRRVGGQI